MTHIDGEPRIIRLLNAVDGVLDGMQQSVLDPNNPVVRALSKVDDLVDRLQVGTGVLNVKEDEDKSSV
jgi:hypothetical protein